MCIQVPKSTQLLLRETETQCPSLTQSQDIALDREDSPVLSDLHLQDHCLGSGGEGRRGRERGRGREGKGRGRGREGKGEGGRRERVRGRAA